MGNNIPANISLFKINKNTRKRCEICSKLTIKTPERCNCHRPGVFIVNSGHFTVSIAGFEQVNVSSDWLSEDDTGF